jgi:hypothetical protein
VTGFGIWNLAIGTWNLSVSLNVEFRVWNLEIQGVSPDWAQKKRAGFSGPALYITLFRSNAEFLYRYISNPSTISP